VIHGHTYVEDNWGTGLKDRMRRNFRRGLEFSRYRYRELLK
jgi:hypothetical protein